MQCSTAIAAAPGRECQDYVLTGPDWVVLLDGATPYPGLDSGCVHGVRWYVRRLAGVLAEALSTDDKDRPLPELLADAISATCAAHGDCCDLSNVDSPSSTVALLRWTEQRCDALVLADSPILLDTADGLVVVEDPRIDQLPAYDVATVSRLRNADGGFWVASTRPEAAEQAVTVSMPGADIHRAGLYTDGATRLVTHYRELDYAGLLDLPPAEVIARTRAIEHRLGPPRHGDRVGKPHDDATAVRVLSSPR